MTYYFSVVYFQAFFDFFFKHNLFVGVDVWKHPWEKNTKKYNKENSNFDPRQNEYWDEWLVDFGINS